MVHKPPCPQLPWNGSLIMARFLSNCHPPGVQPWSRACSTHTVLEHHTTTPKELKCTSIRSTRLQHPWDAWMMVVSAVPRLFNNLRRCNMNDTLLDSGAADFTDPLFCYACHMGAFLMPTELRFYEVWQLEVPKSGCWALLDCVSHASLLSCYNISHLEELRSHE
jgi:hypothetical protein